MKLSQEIINKILDKAGVTMGTPALGSRLSEIIQAETGERLGVNTVNRLMGIYEDGSNPRRFTLEVVSRYLGYNTYEELIKNSENDNSSFLNKVSGDIVSADLKQGALVTITYRPDRMIMLRHEEGDLYIVVRSENSKLLKGDLCTVAHLRSGFPFYVTSVIRNDQNLGRYIAGEDGGVTIVDVM
ncbi:MAG: hypothetical protein KBT10_07400 [Bacteroidales bacterium]|nr:hypothetical protein [Candidatus Sodaliphilus aphodohippi]